MPDSGTKAKITPFLRHIEQLQRSGFTMPSGKGQFKHDGAAMTRCPVLFQDGGRAYLFDHDTNLHCAP